MKRLAILIGVLAMVAAACGGGPAATTAPPGDTAPPGETTTPPPTATGGTVRIGAEGAPDSLNPGNGVLGEAFTIYELVYDTIVSVDLDGNYVPELAKSWSVSDDGLTWTLELVDNAVFHDGTPLTSEDVKFSIELWRDNDFVFLPSYVYQFIEVAAPDPTTVTLTTEEPVAGFEGSMAFMYIVPKHIWELEDDPVAFENEEMIGSGSFKLVEHVQGESVRLIANDDYWNGRPVVDELIFQTIENSDARVTALQTGQVDMIVELPATAIPALQNDPNVTVATGIPLSPHLSDIIFNVTTEELCPADGGVCSGHPALKDLAVRRALAHAVDKQQIIDVALLGLGEPGISLVPTGLGDWFNDSVQDYPFDLDEANRILDEAGYADADGDGVRECLADQSCEDLTFRMSFPSNETTAPRTAEQLSGWWSQVGVAVEIQALDEDTLIDFCCPAFDFDVILWGWYSDPDPGFMLSVASCSEIDTGTSETGYCNEEYEALYEQQRVTTDAAARREIVHQMQEILLRDVPYIIPYYDQVVQAYRNDTFVGWQDSSTRLALEDPSSLNVIGPAG